MTGKQQRKMRKRMHIAAVIATQDAWIESAFSVGTDDRRMRDRMFASARKQHEGRSHAAR